MAFHLSRGGLYALTDRPKEVQARIERGLEICREAEFRYGEGGAPGAWTGAQGKRRIGGGGAAAGGGGGAGGLMMTGP